MEILILLFILDGFALKKSILYYYQSIFTLQIGFCQKDEGRFGVISAQLEIQVSLTWNFQQL
jgi:hypothetical protein